MRKEEITDKLIELSRKIAKYWRMNIYEGCWYLYQDINGEHPILCNIIHGNQSHYRAFMEYCVPIPTISDALRKLGELEGDSFAIVKDADGWYFEWGPRPNAYTENHNTLYEALLTALLQVLESREVEIKQKVSREHIIAQMIETLEWKFSHLPDARQDFVTFRISRNELEKIKDFVEVED